jgi:hypothetical protein
MLIMLVEPRHDIVILAFIALLLHSVILAFQLAFLSR